MFEYIQMVFIQTLDILEIKQVFHTSNEIKLKFGEINTPFLLIEKIMKILPEHIFENPNLKWLDPGAGCGYFTMVIFKKLFDGLHAAFPCPKEREDHIIQNMLYMVEIQKENVCSLIEMFGDKANIINNDFLSMNTKISFDIVIGNPPYNCNGIKKVPTNKKLKKRADGMTVWPLFVKKSMKLLKPGGYLSFIIPSIWLKPDKAKMYNYMMQYNIKKMHCLTNTQTNKIFSGEAQTPTCYFLLKKEPTDGSITLFDRDREQYISYMLRENIPIPVYSQSIINKLAPFLKKAGHLKAYKTNDPGKGTKFSKVSTNECSYINIKTCRLEGTEPKLILNYSNKPQAYNGSPKVILSHKMYGFPYIDEDGDFGISNRDNYVIVDRSKEDMRRISEFLSNKTALYLFEATRYRMKYLEKYIFELIPDITRLVDFPEKITDETIADYFGFDEDDRKNIRALHKKEYVFNPVL